MRRGRRRRSVVLEGLALVPLVHRHRVDDGDLLFRLEHALPRQVVTVELHRRISGVTVDRRGGAVLQRRELEHLRQVVVDHGVEICRTRVLARNRVGDRIAGLHSSARLRISRLRELVPRHGTERHIECEVREVVGGAGGHGQPASVVAERLLTGDLRPVDLRRERDTPGLHRPVRLRRTVVVGPLVVVIVRICDVALGLSDPAFERAALHEL